MAFGGYKFKGYKVVRANLADNTYANWCLLVHQARIKAFMESCALSGAQWHFSKTNGALSFESHGNVIYRVANGNGEYHDYLSFFQYGNEELYYMIGTLGDANSASGTVTSVTLNAKYCTDGSTTASSRMFKRWGFASALSIDDFNDDGPFTSWPVRALACSTQRGAGGSDSDLSTSESAGIYFTASTIFVGVATKGKDIITFHGPNRNDCCVESGDAFSSICDPDDSFGIAKLIVGYNSTETTNFSRDYVYAIDLRNNECLDSSGGRAFGTSMLTNSTYSCLALVPSGAAFLSSTTTKIPYESCYLSTLGQNVNNISGLNLLVKGVVKNELLCCNSVTYANRLTLPDAGTQIMGGNMIAICPTTMYTNTSGISSKGRYVGYQVYGTGRPVSSSSSGTSPTLAGQLEMFPCAYVGWDPSNPNINDYASWPELALQ